MSDKFSLVALNEPGGVYVKHFADRSDLLLRSEVLLHSSKKMDSSFIFLLGSGNFESCFNGTFCACLSTIVDQGESESVVVGSFQEWFVSYPGTIGLHLCVPEGLL